MSESVEAVSLEGRCVRVSVRPPLPLEARVLVLAVAIQVFARYPLFDRLVLAVGAEELSLSRGRVERLTAMEGFASGEASRFRQILTRALSAWDQEETP